MCLFLSSRLFTTSATHIAKREPAAATCPRPTNLSIGNPMKHKIDPSQFRMSQPNQTTERKGST